MSRFGLVEISRKRTGPSLAELLGRPCPTCDGAGAVPALRWRAEELIRAVSTLPRGRVNVLAAPDLHDYLNGAGRAAWQAFLDRSGDRVELQIDPSLAPGDHRIEEQPR
jgi:ribonuclease G